MQSEAKRSGTGEAALAEIRIPRLSAPSFLTNMDHISRGDGEQDSATVLCSVSASPGTKALLSPTAARRNGGERMAFCR